MSSLTYLKIITHAYYCDETKWKQTCLRCLGENVEHRCKRYHYTGFDVFLLRNIFLLISRSTILTHHTATFLLYTVTFSLRTMCAHTRTFSLRSNTFFKVIMPRGLHHYYKFIFFLVLVILPNYLCNKNLFYNTCSSWLIATQNYWSNALVIFIMKLITQRNITYTIVAQWLRCSKFLCLLDAYNFEKIE